MASTDKANFKKWLSQKLNELNTDESVFGSFFLGILEDDETDDEKQEALRDILSEITNENLDEIISEILQKWNESKASADIDKSQVGPVLDVDDKLTKLLEAQKLQTTVKTKEYTAEERKIREQILAQYSQTAISDEEEEAGPDGEEASADKKTTSNANAMGGVERNTNVQDVLQLQKERREQARQDSAAKKLKDKEDREKQKQMREEKKEKRKTVKGERRR